MDYIELICDAEDEDSINVCVQIDDNHDIRIIFNRVFRGGSGIDIGVGWYNESQQLIVFAQKN